MSIEHQAVRQVPLATPFGRQARERGILRGVGLSAAVHVGVIALAVWGGRRLAEAGLAPGEGGGRSGGGGGGGNRVFAVFTLPPALPPAPAAPALVVPSLQALTLPMALPAESVPQQVTAEEFASLAQPTGSGLGAGQGSGVGPGSGSGTGGGSGSGVGTGVGPDSGGSGGSYYPPQPQGIIMPPPDRPSELRGTTVTARFEISARGEVLRVTLDPPIRDRRFSGEFIERLRRYTFTPAYTRAGQPMAAPFEIRITL
jgi:protein TonB